MIKTSGVVVHTMRTIAAYGLALAPSINGFRVTGIVNVWAAEPLIAAMAILLAAVGCYLGGRASTTRRSISRSAMLFLLVLMLFLATGIPRWGSSGFAATRQVLVLCTLIAAYGTAAVGAGLLFDDGMILDAMRTVVLANAVMTLAEVALSVVLGHGVIAPWQARTLLGPYRPCGWFMEPSHYGAYVLIWVVLDEKPVSWVKTALVAAALLAGGSIISLIGVLFLLGRWIHVVWQRVGTTVVTAVSAIVIAILGLGIRFSGADRRLGALDNGSVFARVAKAPLILQFLWKVNWTRVVLGYGPAFNTVVTGYVGDFVNQVLSSGSYLNGWGQGIAWWGIVGVFLSWLVWIAASHSASSFRRVLGVAFILAALQLGADYTPASILFWMPAIVLASATSTRDRGINGAGSTAVPPHVTGPRQVRP